MILTQVSVFSYSCPKFQCLYIFKNLCVDCFRYWTFISLVIHFPFKWPRQEAKTKQQQNKTTFTATRSQKCSPTNRRQTTKLFLARYHRDFALIGQFALPIIFSGIWLAQTSCPIFLKLDSLPICKGKPYLKLSKLILNWTVRKN